MSQPRHAGDAVAKGRLRAEMRARLARMDPAGRDEDSRQICMRLAALDAWRKARVVAAFWPRTDEPDLRAILQGLLDAGGEVGLPSYDPNAGAYLWRKIGNMESHLTAGRFGLREPRPELPVLARELLDFTLVPGLAFDGSGGRLGRGRGFYDRLLAGTRGLACGVGFDFQVLSEVPVESHDATLNLVITPTQTHDCRGAR